MPSSGAYKPDAGMFGPDAVEQALASKQMPYYMVPNMRWAAQQERENRMQQYFRELAAARQMAGREVQGDENVAMINNMDKMTEAFGPVAMMDAMGNGATSLGQSVAGMDYTTRKQPQMLAQGAANVAAKYGEATKNFADAGVGYNMIPQAEAMAGLYDKHPVDPASVRAARAGRRVGTVTGYDVMTGLQHQNIIYEDGAGSNQPGFVADQEAMGDALKDAKPVAKNDQAVQMFERQLVAQKYAPQGRYVITKDGRLATRVVTPNGPAIAFFDRQGNMTIQMVGGQIQAMPGTPGGE